MSFRPGTLAGAAGATGSAGATGATGATGAGFPGTTASNLLAADVTLTNANTYYDGPSVSLGAGTWLVLGAISGDDGVTASIFTAKLWDGSTVWASGQANGYDVNIAVGATVALGGTTTVKISVATTSTSGKIKAATVVNGAGNNASWLTAVQIT